MKRFVTWHTFDCNQLHEVIVAPAFSFCETELITLDVPVTAPSGIVYSTNPYRAEAINGKSYFVKGPDPEIVFAEIGGCILAAEVGIQVPPVALCRANGEMLAGSEKVEEAFRDASIPLKSPHKIINPLDLYNVIVVDSWLGNTDRNLGNVLAGPAEAGRIELIMIDFEKSVTLRLHPRIQSGLLDYRKLWPTGELGQYVRNSKPLHPPGHMLERIMAVNEARCGEALLRVAGLLEAPWGADSIAVVAHRARSIKKIAEEVWRSS